MAKKERSDALRAAQAGWGTTVRYALIRTVERRWAAVLLGSVAGGGLPALIWAYLRTRGVVG